MPQFDDEDFDDIMLLMERSKSHRRHAYLRFALLMIGAVVGVYLLDVLLDRFRY